MASNLPRYTLRIPQIYLEKIHYIAEENGRSTNKELEIMIKQRIKEYEEKNGIIQFKHQIYENIHLIYKS